MYILYFLLAAALIAADYFSKMYILNNMSLYESIPVINGVFHITYVRNTGAAWSMFSGYTAILSLLSATVIVAAIVYIIVKKPKSHMLMTSLILILSGGIGNLYDRIVYKYVVDFLDFRMIDFPVFNFADICVVCGAALLIVYALFFEKRGDRNADCS